MIGTEGTFDVRVVGGGPDEWVATEDWSDVNITTCEGCGFHPLLPVLIRDRSDLAPDGPKRRSWWEGGVAMEHTPERCREARRDR